MAEILARMDGAAVRRLIDAFEQFRAAADAAQNAGGSR